MANNPLPHWQVLVAREMRAKREIIKADRKRSDVLCAAIVEVLDKNLCEEICSFMYMPPRPLGWGTVLENEQYRLMHHVTKRNSSWGKPKKN
jgi:hypothetical protein